jgi:hypothetical protein
LLACGCAIYIYNTGQTQASKGGWTLPQRAGGHRRKSSSRGWRTPPQRESWSAADGWRTLPLDGFRLPVLLPGMAGGHRRRESRLQGAGCKQWIKACVKGLASLLACNR